jgi:hypothetical protein
MGTLGGNWEISIAKGATVTISNAVVNGVDDPGCPWAGITCLGSATIVLEGTNVVRGFQEDYPGIFVPAGKTLTIRGDGSLTASSNGRAAGIGAGYGIACGNIVVEGGAVHATGGEGAAGIGGGYSASCGAIAIGSGIASVTATCGSPGENPIGAGYGSSCGGVVLGGGLVDTTSGSTRTIVPGIYPGIDYGKTVFLSSVSTNTTVADGFLVMGTLGSQTKISIADGATVTISNVVINGVNDSASRWAGITCLGDATIVLEGTNVVRGFQKDHPGIFVPTNKTLTIRGGGSLAASSNGRGAGIGGGSRIDCGDIVVESGTVTATGGSDAAGIGGARTGSCGDIVIGGGTVTATGDTGIGGGYRAPCGDIAIEGGTVTATGNVAAGIGSAYSSACGGITISGGTVTASCGGDYAAGIGSGDDGSCGAISITGGTATATGGAFAVGIGAGWKGYCRSIAMGPNIVRVVATCGEDQDSVRPIGAGDDGSCGAVTIATGLSDTTSGRTRILEPGQIVNLAALEANATFGNGSVLAGTLGGNYGISIADGATVTIRDATINGVDDANFPWAGITCLGDATIVLDGTNVVRGFQEDHPGIFVPTNKTLTIRGGGSLTASSNGRASGIGGGYGIACGDIVVEGGAVHATGGEGAAGIGGGCNASCGGIVVGPDIVRVTATHGASCDNPIGAGDGGTGGAVAMDDARLTDTTEGPTRIVEPSRVVDLAALTDNATFRDGSVLAGTLGGNYRISIADGATVTISNVVINGVHDSASRWAGITCLGDATIVLEGTNVVRGFHENHPGVFVPSGKTLTIRGGGSLAASSNGYGAGIGGGFRIGCGDIVIGGGTVTATGGSDAAGIGCGSDASCGDITVCDGVTLVIATKGDGNGSQAPIGRSSSGSCGTVTVGSALSDVTSDDGKTRTLSPPLTLADDADNTEILRGKDGRTYRTVVLSGRTLYRDGRWNTLCLPFSIDDFTGSPLEGATAMALGSAALNGGLLALDFTNATSIAAGRPYLVRWDDLVIGSAAEWDAFAARVDGGTTYEGKVVRLSADIRVTTMVGTDEHPFRGVFDGAGHTLDVAIDAGETDCAAPFHAIGAAVVRNLVVTGTVSGGIHCAGLVGKCTDGASLIQSCDVRADIVCGGNYCGGILGHSGTVDATIRDCRFGGSIVGAANAIGILFGWGDRPGNHVIDHCLADGTYREGGNIDLLRQNSGNATVEACYKTQNIGSQGTYTTQTGDNLAAQLGDGNWEASGGTAVPKMVASPNVTDPAFQDATIGTALAADEFGCVSFIGDTSPVTLLAGDRTAILVGADGALGVPETETTVNSCRARFRLNGVEAGDDVRYYAMNLGDATMAGKFVEVCEHPGVGPCEMCPYCGERTPLRYLDPADAAEPVKTCADYAIYGSENTLTSGWWVVEGVVTNDTRIEIAGDIHLILRDGAELTAAKGIHVAGANSLAVWAQSGERATAGKLTVSEPDNCLAGIGGNDGESGGTVTVNGGVLDVTGGYKSAAIGGARCGAGGTTTVNGGFVTATGGNWGAGIGGGMAMNANYTSGNAGIVTINGGEVTASGGSWCAGIGGAGGTDSENGGSGGTVAINGGTVTANGGNWSAGIGGGRYGGGVAVVIRGGTVTAETGGGAQAIGEGDGWSGDAGSIAIDGMRVFGSPDATEPVAAENRENACRGMWAKLESCPHLYEDDICLWCGRADPTIAYRAWAGANGVSGAWDAKGADGIHNVFRYAFDRPTGAFANPPLLSIAFDAGGSPAVLTPPLVNAAGFDFSILATEDAAGTSNAVEYALDPSGTNAIPGEIAPARFFRLKATEQ